MFGISLDESQSNNEDIENFKKFDQYVALSHNLIKK